MYVIIRYIWIVQLYRDKSNAPKGIEALLYRSRNRIFKRRERKRKKIHLRKWNTGCCGVVVLLIAHTAFPVMTNGFRYILYAAATDKCWPAVTYVRFVRDITGLFVSAENFSFDISCRFLMAKNAHEKYDAPRYNYCDTRLNGNLKRQLI